MNRQATKKRERERTPNNRTTTGFRISDELWAVLQPRLSVHVNTHRFGGGRPRASDRDCADAIFYVPLERDANGKRWIKPSCVCTRPRMTAFKSGCKRASCSNSGKLASSSLRSCVESTGTGSRWMGRCGICPVGRGKKPAPIRPTEARAG
jgi:hypothetical protein